MKFPPQKLGRDRWFSAAPREAIEFGLEDKLPAELHCARAIVAGDGAEVAIMAAGIDVLEDGVVERVE